MCPASPPKNAYRPSRFPPGPTLFERRRDRSAGVLCALNLRVFIRATIGGSGAFVVPIDDFGSFGDAMLRKLVSEIARK